MRQLLVPIPAVPDYRERLRAPWWWWLAGAVVVALGGAEVAGGYGGWRGWLPYLVLGLVGGGALLLPLRTQVRVRGGELAARDARLPLDVVGQVQTLSRAETHRLLGRDADPAAFAVVRGFIPTAVFLRLDDPSDDTPYWVISSRHPDQLAAAIEAARTRTNGSGRPGNAG